MKARSVLAFLFAALTASAEPISVGAVNCGAFHYGRVDVTEGEYAAGWDGLAADNSADVFFYEDVGTKLFPKGSRGVDGLDIRVVLKDGLGDLPADNVVVSPGMGIVQFEVPQYYKINTDHYPVLAKVDTSDAVAALR